MTKWWNKYGRSVIYSLSMNKLGFTMIYICKEWCFQWGSKRSMNHIHNQDGWSMMNQAIFMGIEVIFCTLVHQKLTIPGILFAFFWAQRGPQPQPPLAEPPRLPGVRDGCTPHRCALRPKCNVGDLGWQHFNKDIGYNSDLMILYVIRYGVFTQI